MDKNNVDITGLDKAEVFMHLYNNAKTQGMGIIHYTPEDMTIIEARETFEKAGPYFDYHKGRVMKINLASDTLWVALYDRDNGLGAALMALEPLLAAK